MRFPTLDEWLLWQEQLHPRLIDLGLERLHRLCERLAISSELPFPSVSIGGTNGKGSTLAFLEAVLLAAGRRVVSYTSPHLRCYNERIRIDGEPVSDGRLLEAFDRIDRARGDETLTYFEFGTLAAFLIAQDEAPDVVLLEVGLGGRLDAVNTIDATVSVITSVGLDHCDWLGNTRDQIALEKVAIGRPGRPLVCAEPSPPETLEAYTSKNEIDLKLTGRDYHYQRSGESWQWWSPDRKVDGIPLPSMAGDWQLGNAAAALAVINVLQSKLHVSDQAIRRGVEKASVAGRFQILNGPVRVILDVAHNLQAIERLCDGLEGLSAARRSVAVFGMMRRKDLSGAIALLEGVFDEWVIPEFEREDMYSADEIAVQLREHLSDPLVHPGGSFSEAIRQLQRRLGGGDQVVIFGSFVMVEAYFNIS